MRVRPRLCRLLVARLPAIAARLGFRPRIFSAARSRPACQAGDLLRDSTRALTCSFVNFAPFGVDIQTFHLHYLSSESYTRIAHLIGFPRVRYAPGTHSLEVDPSSPFGDLKLSLPTLKLLSSRIEELHRSPRSPTHSLYVLRREK